MLESNRSCGQILPIKCPGARPRHNPTNGLRFAKHSRTHISTKLDPEGLLPATRPIHVYNVGKGHDGRALPFKDQSTCKGVEQTDIEPLRRLGNSRTVVKFQTSFPETHHQGCCLAGQDAQLGPCTWRVLVLRTSALELSERLPRETGSICRHSSAKFPLANRLAYLLQLRDDLSRNF